MHASLSRSIWVTAVAVALLLAASLALISAEKPVWGPNDKAFYADPNLVDYVRPGLVTEILNAEITADFTIRAWVKFTDPFGVPLDLDGIETPGAISAGMLVGTIPAGQKQYISYITRTRPNDVTGQQVTQATSDSGGTWEKTGPGEYLYTFGTKAPTNIDRGATHTVGVYARRDLREFDLERPSDDDVFTFVPDGSPVTVVRDVVRTESCNRCHSNLTMHGRRHSVELCILCHTPQSTDNRSPNTVDFKVMIHKLHNGGGNDDPEDQPYTVGGHDFSHVEFPADTRRCFVCHDPDSGAAQADAWLTSPNREACGSCHAEVNFATGEDHAGGPQFTDNLCANCHFPEGETEFDASIIGAHTIERYSKALPGVVVDLMEASGMAGESPTVTFSVKDKSGNPLVIADMDRIRLRLIGPTTDYPREADFEDASGAPGGAGGVYTYTFEEVIPADATGSWAIGVEARNVVTLLAGTTLERANVRDAAFNDIVYFSVDGSEVMPRRTVVGLDNCNSCHYELALHGGNRFNTQYCSFCHNPTNLGEGGPDEDLEESINFPVMIHRIHAGAELEREFWVGGHDYSGLEFPGILQKCDTCHVDDSQQLPISRKGRLDVIDPQGWLSPVTPGAAACLACHDSIEAASHALVNTTSLLGESCSTCHGTDREFSVNKVHAWVR